MLTDTGPLVVVLVASDQHHEVAAQAWRQMPSEPLETILPCITEALYLATESKGANSHRLLWEMREQSKLSIITIDHRHIDCIKTLMTQYEDMPLSIADAALLTVAEAENRTELFTFDQRLRTVQLAKGRYLNIVP